MTSGYSSIPDRLPDREPIHYFLPGRVVFHLEHPARLSSRELSAALGKFLEAPEQAELRRWLGRLPGEEDVLSFPSGGTVDPAGKAFSIIPAQLIQTSQEVVVRLLLEFYWRYRDEGYRFNPIPIVEDGSITLNSLAPSWLMNGAPHQIASGGPGTWPERASVPHNYWPEFYFPKISALYPAAAERGVGVHVAILDTAPCLHELIDAFDKFHGHEGEPTPHPLLESLLGPGSPLHVYPAALGDLSLIGDYSELGHRYKMPDHGLFAAGVIHTIARRAVLHLVEVLNPYGVGSLETIAKGLHRVLNDPKIGRPLVINCSLVLDAPQDGEDLSDFPSSLLDPDLLEVLTLSAQALFDGIRQDQVAITAAAGNDRQGSLRPPARSPASLQRVIGVAALSKTLTPQGEYQGTAYSNLAYGLGLTDSGEKSGYVTWGGEESTTRGDDQGMLGIFIQEFPHNISGKPNRDRDILLTDFHYHINNTGWARWAGTSFAAPVIAGLLAAWWGIDLTRTESEARAFLDQSALDRTDQQEKVILVEQS